MEDVARIQDLISAMQKENCSRTILDKANHALQYIKTLKGKIFFMLNTRSEVSLSVYQT